MQVTKGKQKERRSPKTVERGRKMTEEFQYFVLREKILNDHHEIAGHLSVSPQQDLKMITDCTLKMLHLKYHCTVGKKTLLSSEIPLDIKGKILLSLQKNMMKS